MSKQSKICYIVSFLVILGCGVAYFILNSWLNLFSVLLGIAGFGVAVGIFFDRRLFIEFLSMRTTKHGANMGLLIIMSLALVVAANYLGYRFNKTFDLSEEKINSLSQQTQQVLKGLKEDLTFTVLYTPEYNSFRQQMRNDLGLYVDQSAKVKLRFVNSYENPGLAMEYLKDRGTKTAVFAEYRGRKIMVETPYNETNVSTAIVKATRETEKTIYFTTGHGEPNIDGQDGLTVLREGIERMSFKVANLNLAMGDNMPTGDAVIAIIGPKTAFMDIEIQRLRDFVNQGGRLLIAIDPGQSHNLANLTRTFGVEFKNNFLLSLQLRNNGLIVAAPTFDRNSEITRSFPEGASVAAFIEASELARTNEAPSEWTFYELVKTEPRSVAFFNPNAKTIESDQKARLVGVQVDIPLKKNKVTEDKDGKVTESPSENPRSKAMVAVFGDSDFFTDRAINTWTNRDLAFNVFATLGREPELAGIRPAQMKSHSFLLTRNYFYGIVAGSVVVPLVLLGFAGFFWYRRRNL